MSESRLAVIAVGGNALVTDPRRQAVADQFDSVATSMKGVVDLICDGWTVVITHGNGPQVGFVLRRSELSAGERQALSRQPGALAQELLEPVQAPAAAEQVHGLESGDAARQQRLERAHRAQHLAREAVEHLDRGRVLRYVDDALFDPLINSGLHS